MSLIWAARGTYIWVQQNGSPEPFVVDQIRSDFLDFNFTFSLFRGNGEKVALL
jgi:hypothetical protein